MSEKIQKVLANMGLGSRREIEQWISAGRVEVNNALAKLGDRAGDEDVIKLDGRLLRRRAKEENKSRVIIYNKQEGEVCTRSDPEGRPTVFDHLPKLRGERWIAVGRLDINTTGLLLFTNDGQLANKLMHPSTQIERQYVVRVRGEVSDEMMRTLKKGVMLEDGMAQFKDIERGREQNTNGWFSVTLLEGRNREVRRLWDSQGVTVSRLKRVRYGCVSLPAPVLLGRWKELEEKEVKQLYKSVAMAIIEKEPEPIIEEEVKGARGAKPIRGKKALTDKPHDPRKAQSKRTNYKEEEKPRGKRSIELVDRPKKTRATSKTATSTKSATGERPARPPKRKIRTKKPTRL
jgi:23S rRNA pseudouridine2605 synthase